MPFFHLRYLLDPPGHSQGPHGQVENDQSATGDSGRAAEGVSSLADSESSRVRRIMSDPVTLTSGDPDEEKHHHRCEVADNALAQVLRTGHITRAVNAALNKLSSRERDVVQRRFGLAGRRRQTLEEIGRHLKLSRERIRQIERQVLLRMRYFRDLAEIHGDLAARGRVVSARTPAN